MARVAVLRDPAIPTGTGQFGVIQAAASPSRVDIASINLRAMSDVESGLAGFAQKPNGRFIVTANPFAIAHCRQINELAGRLKLPAVYFEPMFAKDGGFISYGPDIVDQYRRAAGYVDRIFKGEKSAGLPVQTSTKYQLMINLKTATALGITALRTMLTRADEVLE